MSSPTKTFLEITAGFKNLIFKTKEHEEMATLRADICSKSGPEGNECESLDPEHPFKKWMPGMSGKGEKITGMGCKICNCYLPAKVRSPLSSCPLDKW